jgi:hypothetical protein
VASALGVGLESCAIDPNPPASVYVALDAKLSGFPDRDLALLWDERLGWSAAVEAHAGKDLIVVTYRGGELLPDEPRDVVGFVRALVADRWTAGTTPPHVVPGDHRTMMRTLRDYAS